MGTLTICVFLHTLASCSITASCPFIKCPTHTGLSPLAPCSYSSDIFQFHNHMLTSCSFLKYPAAHTHPWHSPRSFVVVPATGGIGFGPCNHGQKILPQSTVSEPCDRWNRNRGTQTNLLLCVDRNIGTERKEEMERMSLICYAFQYSMCTTEGCKRKQKSLRHVLSRPSALLVYEYLLAVVLSFS